MGGNTNPSGGISFSQRMSLLEKVAFYRPLANVPPTNATHTAEQHRYVACDCRGFECDQQIEAFYEEIRRAVKNARAIMLQEIQNNPQISGGAHDTVAAAAAATAATSPTYHQQIDDTSECREFLRVQYNLNNLYKQELELICKTCKQQRQELLKQIDMLKAKLQNYEDKLKSHGRSAGEMVCVMWFRFTNTVSRLFDKLMRTHSTIFVQSFFEIFSCGLPCALHQMVSNFYQ